MKRAIGWAALAAAAWSGCGGDPQLAGVARMALAKVPANVQCISLQAAGSRTVQQSFDVMPLQAATLDFPGVPTGAVTFSGQAYNSSCAAIGNAAPTWSSDPATAQVVAGTPAAVHLVFHAAGDATVSIDFDDGSSSSGCGVQMWANHTKWVVNQITLPEQRTDFAIDLNGDGRVDNQYGNVVGALTAQNMDVQGQTNSVVASGADPLLVDIASNDPMGGNDPCAGASLLAGLPTSMPPRFDGSDVFTVDPMVPGGTFTGPLANGQFTSADPATATTPANVTVKLPFFGAAFVRVPLIGARLQVQEGGLGMATGQLNGAIRNSDLQTIVVPGLAKSLSDSVAANPGSSNSKQLLAIFDNGGTPAPMCGQACANPDGSCAVAGDGVISTCELGSSALVKNVLAPDVQMFDANGNYHPNPANSARDSFSVGLRVSVAPATF